MNKKAKSMCLGLSTILHAFEGQLLRHIFHLKDQGMAVSLGLAVIKASSLSREFKERAASAQYCSV